MSGRQCKITFSNIKSNMVSLETSGSITTIPEHLNTGGIDENSLKNKLLKMIDALRKK